MAKKLNATLTVSFKSVAVDAADQSAFTSFNAPAIDITFDGISLDTLNALQGILAKAGQALTADLLALGSAHAATKATPGATSAK